MKKTLYIVPYSEYWNNCIINERLSIAQSIEPSYKNLGYLNEYTYEINGSSAWWREITLNLNNDVYQESQIGEYIDINIDKNNIINEIKHMIDEERYISILLDLYCTIENSLDWGNNHYHHYRLFTGYDDEKQLLYLICDYIGGYGECEISYSQFMEAVVLNDEQSVAQEFILNVKMPPYICDYSKVTDRAKTICASIKNLYYSKLWILPSDIAPLRITTHLTKFEERQKANQLLFSELGRKKWISPEYSAHLFELSKKIQYAWKKMKYITMKANVMQSNLDLEQINHASTKALRMEYEMWNEFINYKLSYPDIDLEGVRLYLDTSDMYSTIIALTFNNVSGNLIPEGADTCGFSLILDNQDNQIKSVKCDKNKVILYTELGYYYTNNFSIVRLCYRPTIGNSIHDQLEHSIPYLSNVQVESRNMSEYVNIMKVSKLIPLKHEFNTISYNSISQCSVHEHIFNTNICVVDELCDRDELYQNMVLFRLQYLCEDMNERLHIGYSGLIKIWINGELKYEDYNKVTPIDLDDFIYDITTKEIGILIAFTLTDKSNTENIKGIAIKFETKV